MSVMGAISQGRRVGVLSFSHLGTDPRVHRQIGVLAQQFAVTAIGWGPPAVPGVAFRPVPPVHWALRGKILAALLLKLGRFEQAYWSSHCVRAAAAVLQRETFDLIVANDIQTLPLALRYRSGARVLFDAHEYAPLEFEESPKWRFFFQRYYEYLCQRYVPLADAAITVCDGIAGEFGRTVGARMTIIHNSPAFQDLLPSHAAHGTPIRLVHHGGAIPSRRLETMIEVMRHLDDRFTLDLILVPSVPRYLDRLKGLAAGDRRIRFPPPAPMLQLPAVLNAYDVGIYLLPPNNFNNRHALPNKFFEFVQARLAIAIGPSPEMAVLVNRYGMGVVSQDFSPSAFAQAVSSLDRARIGQYKAAAAIAARELSFEQDGATFLQLIDRTLSAPCAA